ncbi:MAG: SRPBCC domain-containing protein [Pseudomonadota bacterium]
MGLTIGPLHMRRSIFIQAIPSRVWQEFTSFERINAWFGHGHQLHKFEPRVGGTVDLSIENDMGIDACEDGRVHFVGEVLIVEPEREVSFKTDWQPKPMLVPSLWTMRLTPVYDGTLVEIFDHGYERFGAGAADYLQGTEEGWDIKHLKVLRAIIEN